MASMAYPLYLPYLSQKSVGEWWSGEWSKPSVDLFRSGGLRWFSQSRSCLPE